VAASWTFWYGFNEILSEPRLKFDSQGNVEAVFMESNQLTKTKTAYGSAYTLGAIKVVCDDLDL